MTRLADALQRANARTPTVSPGAGAPPPAASAPALSLVTEEPDIRLPAGTPLLALPKRMNGPTVWRTDPELIGKLVGTDGFPSGGREQYRKLAAALHHAQVERDLKVVLTSSALPGEGKSLSAVNTALTLSESLQRRVLLIDADLRRPTIQRIFGIPPVGGLNEILKAQQDHTTTVAQLTERLFLLPAGRPDADPLGGLTSPRMERVLAHASAMFEWVIVDTPPLGLLPDAGLLTQWVGGVLLVVRCGKAPFQLVKRTVEAVGRDRIVGVIMNAVDLAHDRNAGGYYEYYGYGYGGTAERK